MEKISKDEFRKIPIDTKLGETIDGPEFGYWKNVAWRFKSNKLALFAAIILLVIILTTIIGPYVNEFSFDEINGAIRNQGPSLKHWFGTDELGRDIFARVCRGTGVSLIIGLSSALIASMIGILYGSFSAYSGGMVDIVMMRLVEIIFSIPYLIWVILISVLMGSRSLGAMIITLTITGWCSTARLVRGQVLKIKEEEYIMAAEVMGVNRWKIISRHLIPNTLEVIFVSITFAIPGFIFSESLLSYIGLGIERPEISLGGLAALAQENIKFYPYQLFFPGMIMVLIMLSFILLGDGLREALDPRLRE